VDERYLDTGQLTGRRFDSEHGEISDMAVVGGNELLTFVGGYTRWRLDGSSPVSRLVAPGVTSAGYDDAGRLLLVWDPVEGRDSVVDTRSGATLLSLRHGEDGQWLGGDSLLVTKEDGPPELLDVTTGTSTPAPPLFADIGRVFRNPSGNGRAWVVHFVEDSGDVRELVEVNANDGAVVTGPVPVPGPMLSVSSWPDGAETAATFVAASEAGSYLDWRNLSEGVTLAVVDSGTGSVNRTLPATYLAAVSPLGTVVTSDNSGGIVQRDPKTLKPVATLAGSRGHLEQLTFDRDGGTLMATGDEGFAQLYDSRTWTRLAEIPTGALEEAATEAWLRPDGKAVAVNGEYGVAEWTLEPDRLADAACAIAGRNLTRAEWATYLPDQPYSRTCPGYPAGT
jgi:hypothetical protein